jgi:hypothetical protein
MPRLRNIWIALSLTLGMLACNLATSQAYGEKLEVDSNNHHYFVHAGNCSRSITLVRACTCPDEAEYIAQEYRDRDYRLVWIKTTPKTYGE